MSLIAKKSQIWIETVIYTMIGLTVIGLILAFATPKIEETKDRVLTNRAVSLLKSIEGKIEELDFHDVGNSRSEKTEINKGRLIIDGVEDNIEFEMKTSYEYSESGERIKDGKIGILTEDLENDEYNVNMLLNYTGRFNITFDGKEERKEFGKSASSYKFLISNKGNNGGNKTNINFKRVN